MFGLVCTCCRTIAAAASGVARSASSGRAAAAAASPLPAGGAGSPRRTVISSGRTIRTPLPSVAVVRTPVVASLMEPFRVGFAGKWPLAGSPPEGDRATPASGPVVTTLVTPADRHGWSLMSLRITDAGTAWFDLNGTPWKCRPIASPVARSNRLEPELPGMVEQSWDIPRLSMPTTFPGAQRLVSKTLP